MDVLEAMWLGWASVAIVGVLALLITAIGNRLPTDPEKRAAELERRWRGRRIAEGADPYEIEEERQLRMALAELRYDASEAARKKPRDYEKAITDAKAKQADKLRVIASKERAAKFMRIVRKLKMSDILYPDAMDAVRKANGWDKMRPPIKASKRDHKIRAAAFTDLK